MKLLFLAAFCLLSLLVVESFAPTGKFVTQQTRAIRQKYKTSVLFSSETEIKQAAVKPEAPKGFVPPQSSVVSLKDEPVFAFGKSQKPGNYGGMKKILGGKGANLADMSSIGLSVPPGFTITTEVCAAFHSVGRKLPAGVWEQVLSSMKEVESQMGRKFGDAGKPLLVSVRSGAAISMPGMMDTVLNLGLNDETVAGLSKEFGERFALVSCVANCSSEPAHSND